MCIDTSGYALGRFRVKKNLRRLNYKGLIAHGTVRAQHIFLQIAVSAFVPKAVQILRTIISVTNLRTYADHHLGRVATGCLCLLPLD